MPWVDPDGVRDSTTQVTVSANQNNITTDFGYVVPASLSGVVFNDISGNGSQGAGELGTSGVTVYLDLNGNGALDLGEPTQVTNSNGAVHVYRTAARHVPGPRTVAQRDGPDDHAEQRRPHRDPDAGRERGGFELRQSGG